MAVMLGASVVYFAVSAYVLRLAGRTHSPAVYAEAMHLRTHVYITFGLLAGLVLSRVGLAQGWPHAELYVADLHRQKVSEVVDATRPTLYFHGITTSATRPSAAAPALSVSPTMVAASPRTSWCSI